MFFKSKNNLLNYKYPEDFTLNYQENKYLKILSKLVINKVYEK